MLWEHEPQASVSTIFSSSPILSRENSPRKITKNEDCLKNCNFYIYKTLFESFLFLIVNRNIFLNICINIVFEKTPWGKSTKYVCMYVCMYVCINSQSSFTV